MRNSRYSCMLSALMITPPNASASRIASVDLPLAVGPPITIVPVMLAARAILPIRGVA